MPSSAQAQMVIAKLNQAQFQLSFSLAGLRLVLFLHNPAIYPTRESIFRALLAVHMLVITVAKLSLAQCQISFSFAGLRLALFPLNPSHPHLLKYFVSQSIAGRDPIWTNCM